MEYVIIKCPYCKNYLTAPTNIKTRTCPYCGRKLKIPTLKVIARAKNGREAAFIVKILKAKEAGMLEILYGDKKEKHRSSKSSHT